jgi:hypothetical protein
MRFFSNEAQDNVDEKTDRPTDTPVAVPQQRAGSPWQHDTGPTPEPTAVGTSTVGDTNTVSPDDDPDRTHKLPDTTDRTVSFSDVATRDRSENTDNDQDKDWDAVQDTTPEHSLPEDSQPRHKLPEDTRPEDTTPEHTTPEDTTPEDFPLKEEDRDEEPKDEVAADTKPEIDPEPAAEPVTEPAVAAPTTGSGTLPFFPAADTQPLRDRWRDVQLRFVDDPKGATAEASTLVDDAVDKLSTALRDHRSSFAKGTDDTESLRVELRSYRDILDRLLGL